MFAQQWGGLSIGGGIEYPGALTFSGSYFHPVLMKQFYVDGGLRRFYGAEYRTDDIHNQFFTNVNQAFVGVRLGDYLFANPRITWSWYGKYKSLGWGLTGGLLIPVAKQLSIGFGVGYDQIRFDTTLDNYGATRITSVSVVMNVGIF
jgi:hypothetical protein